MFVGNDMLLNVIYLFTILFLLCSLFWAVIFAKKINPKEALFLKAFLEDALRATELDGHPPPIPLSKLKSQNYSQSGSATQK